MHEAKKRLPAKRAKAEKRVVRRAVVEPPSVFVRKNIPCNLDSAPPIEDRKARFPATI
jgi:hypothetical protein